MLDNILTNVFGRSKSRNSSAGGRNSQHDVSLPSSGSSSIPSPMTGPFAASTPQMPQMPQPATLPYPPVPYPMVPPTSSNCYPSLPFGQPPNQPADFASNNYPLAPTGTLSHNHNFSPLDSVPFEAKLSINTSTNLVNLDQILKDIKQAAQIVDRADAYLSSNQSDYDFKIEQGLIYQ